MTIELERVSIGGVWQWQAVSETPGGGSVSEITSDDNSVTITNPTGPTVDLSVSGGSLPLTLVVKEVVVTAAEVADAWSIPDSWGIVPLSWTPAEGDIIFGNPDVSIAAGDGFHRAGGVPYVGNVKSQSETFSFAPDYDLTAEDSATAGYSFTISSDGSTPGGNPPIGTVLTGPGAEPLVFKCRDNDGEGNTPPTSGAVTIRFLVAIA